MTNFLARRMILICSAILPAACAVTVEAASISFSYAGPGVAAQGTFETDDPVPGEICPYGCTVLSVSDGIRNGQFLTLVPPMTCCPPGSQGNDNHLNPIQPGRFTVDGFGVGFAAGGIDYNIYKYGLEPLTELSSEGNSIILTCFEAAVNGGATCGGSVQPEDPSTGASPVTLTFPAVTKGGLTTLSIGSTGPAPPAGYKLGDPPMYFDVSSTAVFSGSVGICIDYSGMSFADETQLRLFHFDGANWVDVTTSLDTPANVICGSTTSLSPFIVAEVPGPGAKKCEAAIIKAASGFVQANTKALQQCREGIVKGKLSGATDCHTHEKTAAALAKAGAKLNASIVKACAGKDKICGTNDTGESAPAAVGWGIGSCPNFEGGDCTNPIQSCSDIPVCIECISEGAVDQAIDLYYASLTTTDPKRDKDLNKCQAAIGKSAAKFLATKSKTLAKCWAAVRKGKGTAPCPSPGDGKTASAIAAAASKKDAAIKKACQGPDKVFGTADDFTPLQIGFPATCLDSTAPLCAGTVSSLQELIDCVDCVTEFDVDCADRAAVPGFVRPYPAECNPGATATPTPTPTATPTATPTPGWTCNPSFYGTNDGCDCGCGIVDPDCADATVGSCAFCDGAGSCATGPCPANIDPTNNAVCT